MAALFSRSRNITHLLKAKICPLEKLESRFSPSSFHADSCYHSMAGEHRRKSTVFWDKSPGNLAFRRYESARAGGQVEPVPDTDNEDEENQRIFDANFGKETQWAGLAHYKILE